MDILKLAKTVLESARQSGVMIATAESCTGGLVFAALSEIAGASDVMDAGFITYSDAAKTEMLGVDGDLIAQVGAVSEPVAIAMADGALRRSKADCAVSVTGVAGPGASDNKPEGLVVFALAHLGHPTRAATREFGAIGRAHVRAASVERALTMLAEALG